MNITLQKVPCCTEKADKELTFVDSSSLLFEKTITIGLLGGVDFRYRAVAGAAAAVAAAAAARDRFISGNGK